jgi:hypothetical protein
MALWILVLYTLSFPSIYAFQNKTGFLNYTVGITDIEPLIYIDNLVNPDQYRGILFDIWEESIKHLNISCNYSKENDLTLVNVDELIPN